MATCHSSNLSWQVSHPVGFGYRNMGTARNVIQQQDFFQGNLVRLSQTGTIYIKFSSITGVCTTFDRTNMAKN